MGHHKQNRPALAFCAVARSCAHSRFCAGLHSQSYYMVKVVTSAMMWYMFAIETASVLHTCSVDNKETHEEKHPVCVYTSDRESYAHA